MVEPVTASLIAAGIQAAGSLGGGYLSGRSSGQETKMQRTQRKLIDQLIASLSGQGPYSDLYNYDEDVFNKSFVDPAKSLFKNQIAPQIQQQFIATGQQRSSGLEDQLLRAGVDLDQLLNQHMAEFQQGAMNRKQNTISNILGAGSGGTQAMSPGQAFGQAGAGYISSDAFSSSVSDILSQYTKEEQPKPSPLPRKGYEY